jgi:hypothetical protein
MTTSQEKKIRDLLEQYNDILLVSMRLAIAEDFINLVIVNRDDTDFELAELLKDKEAFSNYVMREFLKQNSSSVVDQLKGMDEPIPELGKRFRSKKIQTDKKTT